MGCVNLEIRGFVLNPTDAIEISIDLVFDVFFESVVGPRTFPDSRSNLLVPFCDEARSLGVGVTYLYRHRR